MFAILKKHYPTLVSASLNLGEEKSRYSFRLDKEIPKQELDQIEEEVREKISEAIPVSVSMSDRKQAEKVCTPALLKLVPESQKEIRLLSIGDFNTEACIGEHVSNTKEIGTFRFLKHEKIGKDTYRLDFTVNDEGGKADEFSSPSGKFELQLAKGVRDFPPEEKIVREKVVDTLREVFMIYGYSPLETPQFERLDVLMAKFGAGEGSDAAKEIFKLRDQGGRELGLRFDLTLPLCRFIAMNPNIKMPFKRYEIGRVYRDGPIKLGRYREFWQCDVDIVGTKSMLADAEVLAIAKEVFRRLEFDVVIEVSNRKLLNGILEAAGVPQNDRMSAMITIDKLKKIGADGVRKEMEENGLSSKAIQSIIGIINIKGTNQEKLDKLRELVQNDIGKEGLDELEQMFSFLSVLGVEVEFNPTLARGLTYYTGPIYEVFLKGSKITGSVVGGGRYDEFIGNYLGKKQQIPATGLSFGIEPITEAIKLRAPTEQKTVAQVYVIPIRTQKESLGIVQELRKAGIRADIDIAGRGISKNLDFANSLGIPYVIFVGEDELKSRKLKLRDMKSGKEEALSVKELIERLAQGSL